MTQLSVNVNKIAVLRNSRGGNEPDVVRAARACLAAGAHGITVHPRPDQRHIRSDDVHALSAHWRWGASLAYTRKTGGNVTGDARDVQVELEYFPWRHAGFSLRYNYNDVDLDFERTRFDGNLNLNNRGPQLLAMLRF